MLYWPTSNAVNGSLNNVVIGAAGAEGAGAEGTCTEGVGKESACTGSACTVKHSRIHLQSFLISEMELFNTGW